MHRLRQNLSVKTTTNTPMAEKITPDPRMLRPYILVSPNFAYPQQPRAEDPAPFSQVVTERHGLQLWSELRANLHSFLFPVRTRLVNRLTMPVASTHDAE